MSLLLSLILAINLQAACRLDGKPPKPSDKGLIGISIGSINHKIYRVWPHTPAEQAGLQSGDDIVAVCDDQNKHDIIGPVGSEVVLVVRRNGASFPVHVRRVAAEQIVRSRLVGKVVLASG